MANSSGKKPGLVGLIIGILALALVLGGVSYYKYQASKQEARQSAEKKKGKKEKKESAEAKEKKSKYKTPLDFDTLPDDDWPAAIKKVHAALKWNGRDEALNAPIPAGAVDPTPYMRLKMNRDLLTRTFELGTNFMVRNQKPGGNFNYMYDWLKRQWVDDDNQVRQAGVLWGIALCHKYKPTKETKAALEKGFKFWYDRTIDGPENTLTVRYASDEKTSTGTLALIALAMTEYLTTEKNLPAAPKAEMTKKLEGYLAHLKWLQRTNGHFPDGYIISEQRRSDRSSPYFDGETLLCLSKAAKYLGYNDLVPVIEKGARGCAETYTIKAWKKDPDSKDTKGFYQWSSMTFAEYYEAKWKDYELFGDATLALGWWMIHTHDVLDRNRNHAYAQEGLISAYRIAKARGDMKAMVDLLYIIDRSFYKLTSWQIGGPLVEANPFLVENKTDDPVALGGIMNSAKAYPDKPPEKGDTRHELRIDVTQHQMHAVTLALRHVYTNGEKK
jgi:hypothetical protein